MTDLHHCVAWTHHRSTHCRRHTPHRGSSPCPSVPSTIRTTPLGCPSTLCTRQSRGFLGVSADTRRYYITASGGTTHRVLKIDRTDPESLHVVSDDTHYDSEQLQLLLRMVEDGNKSQGGLNRVMDFYGIVGFTKFTSTWYLCVITQRSVVGLLGGHYSAWGVDRADPSLPLRQDQGGGVANTAYTSCSRFPRRRIPRRRRSEWGLGYTDDRLQNIFDSVDLSKNFYFSCVANEHLTQILVRHYQHSAKKPHCALGRARAERPVYVELPPSAAGL